MSIITPDSELKLYRDVDITDEKHLIFQSAQEREAYFASHLFRSNVDFSYMKIGEPITLEIDMADIYKFNYISFKNKSFENKIIYARCRVVPNYVNNEVVQIVYDVDATTTFMFDVEFEECEIEREHLSEAERAAEIVNPFTYDIASEFTPEPLSYDLSIKSRRTAGNTKFIPIIDFDQTGLNDYAPCICVVTSQDIVNDEPTTPAPRKLRDLHFASVCSYHFFDWDDNPMTNLQTFIEKYNTAGCISSILGTYVLPNAFNWVGTSASGVYVKDQDITINLGQLNNGKLHRFPYLYLRMTDPVGNVKEYHLEKFSDPLHVTFGVFYTINAYPQVVLVPKDYDRWDDALPPYNYDEKMVYTDFPQMAFNTDGFLTWYGNAMRGQMMKDATASPIEYNPGVSLAKMVGSAFGSVGGAGVSGGSSAGGEGAALMAAAQTPNALFNFIEQSNANYIKYTQHELAQQFADGQTTPTELPTYLQQVRAAVVHDDYHGGNGSVASLCAYQFNRVGFYLDVVNVTPSILKKYDKFLDNYGYNTGRLGIPRIAYYIGTAQGSADDNPIFVNNKTFVKTLNCHVKAPTAEIAKAIETLMNNGHWFEKVVSNG